MKRVLIVGASSFIGGNIAVRLREKFMLYGTYATHRPRLNEVPVFSFPLEPKSPIHELVRKLSPDAIVYCPALTNDACDNDPTYARFLNSEAPLRFAEALEEIGGRLIYFSSSKVFSGEEGSYTEADTPHPTSNYGISKLQAEEGLEFHEDAFIFRLGTVFGLGSYSQHSAILARLLKELWTKPENRYICDENRSFIGVDEVARAVELAVEASKEKSGTYHIAGPEAHTYFSFAETIAKVFGITSTQITPVKGASFREGTDPKNRGADLTLSAKLFEETFGTALNPLESSLRLMKEELRLGRW